MRWSEQEIEYLKKNYAHQSNELISSNLNRTVDSIMNMAYTLKLKKTAEQRSKMIGKRNKMVGRDLNYETLKKIAANYKTRADFQRNDSSAYKAARLSDKLDEICTHMIKQSFSIPQLILKFILSEVLDKNIHYNTRKVIKPYELDIYLPDYKLAFEYNGKGWHIEERVDKYKLCQEKSITLFTIFENSRNYEIDIKSQLINLLPEINAIINRKISSDVIENLTINSVIFDDILDEEYINNICNKYQSYVEFRKSNILLYNKLRKINKLNEYTKHMIKGYKYWNVEQIKEEISKYEYIDELINKSHSCYSWVKRNKREDLLINLKFKQNKKLKIPAINQC